MRWAVVAACIACIAALGAAAPAVASARVEQVEVRFGFVAKLTGAGCVPGTLARSAEGNQPLRFDPAMGNEIGSLDSVVVTAATLGVGQVSWTAQPTAKMCASYDGDPSWTWSTGEQSWSVTYRTSAYTIRANPRGGIRTIGGFRVRPYTRRSAPTIRRARQHFGRPSSLRRRYGVGCRARWNRIGLTIDVINLGGRDPCRHGFVQVGHVRGGAASKWTALVANDPGVVLGTSDAFLEEELVGESGETGRAWTLAEVFIPYGDAGYYPSLSAILDRGGTVRGFEFYVGAGGD